MSNLQAQFQLLRRPASGSALAWAAAVAALGLLLSLGEAWSIHTQQKGEDETHLARFSAHVLSGLDAHLARMEDMLRVARGLARLQPEGQRWQEFQESLGVPVRLTGLRQVALVPPGGLATLPEPLREVAQRAQDSGAVVMSGPIPTAGGQGVTFFLPVNAPPSDPSPEPPASGGWVSLSLDPGPMLARLVFEGNEEVDVTVTDGTTTLYSSRDPAAAPVAPARQVGKPVFNRTWTFAFQPRAAFFHRDSRMTWGRLFILGLLCTVGASWGAWTLASTRARASRLATQLSRSAFMALRRFDALVQTAPLALLEWDLEGRVRSWNPAATRLFGYVPGEVVHQDGREILFAEADRSAFDACFGEACAGRTPPTTHLRARHKEGGAVHGEWSFVAIRTAQGLIQGVIVLVLDISATLATEAAARQSQRLESLGILAGGIAHEFNNLLGIITGQMEQASAKAQADFLGARNHLDLAERAVARAAALARQMLAYAGRAPISAAPLDLNRTLSDVLDLLRGSFPALVAVQLDLQEGLPPVRMDEVQLQQVIASLVTNAAEAVEGTPGHITLRTRRTSLGPEQAGGMVPGLSLRPGPAVDLEVADEGCGMAPEVLGRIFDPFFTTKFAGRGLGLSAVLGILRAHGASLRVESRPGLGSRFQVFLPQHEGEVAPRAPEGMVPHAHPTTVLFADDEPMLRDLAEEALEADGHLVLLAPDGEAALALFAAHRHSIGVVVLDMTMPRLGGMEAYQRIRALDAEMPVILSSGFPERDFPGTEGTAFLPKPYRLQDLRSLVARTLAPHSG
jgi:PAS domain S-box-containing protein